MRIIILAALIYTTPVLAGGDPPYDGGTTYISVRCWTANTFGVMANAWGATPQTYEPDAEGDVWVTWTHGYAWWRTILRKDGQAVCVVARNWAAQEYPLPAN